MCGIVGGNCDTWNYKGALASIRHRGPDGLRIESTPEFSLGFVRLSIIDLSENGMQPMMSDDSMVTMVFNGEIYDYQRLRSELMEKKYRFHSTTDTEVLLNAYLEYGDSFIEKVDGMFAIGILDKREQCVKLFRDRTGIKPLYYYDDGRRFAFASELKALEVLCNDVVLEEDKSALYDYLTYNYIPDPKTMYKYVLKLMPAHYLKYDLKKSRIIENAPYWKLQVNQQAEGKGDIRELAEETRRLLQQSVKNQLIADVPVGSFLSGGIDSSIVTYEIKQVNPQIESFSIGFTYEKYDELRYAKKLAAEQGIIHNSKVVTRDDVRELFPCLKDWYDEPFADTSAYPTYLVAKLAREKVTVVLTGDGGDELFGGYSKYNGYSMENCGDDIHLNLVKIDTLSGGLPSASRLAWKKQLGIPEDYDDYWAYRKYYRKDLPKMTRLQYIDLHTYLPGDILTKVDRVSMAVSLEARVPFLSREVIEFAFSMPQNLRYLGGELKGMLKKAYSGKISDEILHRRKMGFVIPNSYLEIGDSESEAILTKLWGHPAPAGKVGMDGKLLKFKSYYNLLNQWLILKNRGIDLAEYFIGNGLKRVAIYGMGEIGCRLWEELHDGPVDVLCGIDKEGGSPYGSLRVYTYNESWPEVDVIVVTAVFAFDKVRADLSKKTDARIISLEDVLAGVGDKNESTI